MNRKFISNSNYVLRKVLNNNSNIKIVQDFIESILDIKIENTYAFGDGKNDIEMLSTVGCGIAMGNASDEVKKYSNKITDTVQNDGVAKGIEQYVYTN